MSRSGDGLALDFEIRISSYDLYDPLNISEDREATDAEIVAGGTAISDYVFSWITLDVPGQDCELTSAPVVPVVDGQRFAKVLGRLICPRTIRSTSVHYELFFELDASHEGLMRVDGGLVQFTNSSRVYEHRWGDAVGQSRYGFLRSGVEHVLGGFDHILFLVSLLLVIGLRQEATGLRARTVRESLRSAATIVTAFTIGHSLTLILAALGWIALPSRFVESMIAASIVYVAIENLFRPDPPRRYLVTLAFGLMHGLGFAAMLRPLLPPHDVVVPLLVFNIGVELGQLAIVALTLPLLTLALSILGVETYRRKAMPLASCTIAAMGLFWLVQRALAL